MRLTESVRHPYSSELPVLVVTDLAQLLRTASRTFAVGIERLPAGLLEEVRTAYLLLRVSDYLEDNEEMTPEEKTGHLLRWSETLEGKTNVASFASDLPPIRETTPDAEVARRVEDVFAAFAGLQPSSRDVLAKHVADTSRGMARWSERGPDFQTEADLDDYMHEVAGRVGLLLTDLFALRSDAIRANRPAMLISGREFGLGLQTVNVIRGLHEDRHRGWLFVPREFVPVGIDHPDDLFREEHKPDALAVLDRLTTKAESHLGAALTYVENIPRSMKGVRVFCVLPLFFALRTLGVSRGNASVFEREVKMSRAMVTHLTARTEVFWWSNRWLRATAHRLSRGV